MRWQEASIIDQEHAELRKEEGEGSNSHTEPASQYEPGQWEVPEPNLVHPRANVACFSGAIIFFSN